MVGQHPTQVVQASLASTVCESLECRNPQSINTSDVNDPGGVARGSSILEQRRDELRDVEDTLEVQCKDSCPGGGWIFIVRCTPVRARVVDEDMKLCKRQVKLVGLVLHEFQCQESENSLLSRFLSSPANL